MISAPTLSAKELQMLDQLSREIVSRAVSLANEQGFAVCISVVDDA